MEYIYASMLLHTLNKEITEDSVKKVMQAAGANADDSKVKALVASLKEVNIKEAMEKAAMPVAVAAAPVAVSEKKEEKKKDEEKKSEEEAAAGLGALFG